MLRPLQSRFSRTSVPAKGVRHGNSAARLTALLVVVSAPVAVGSPAQAAARVKVIVGQGTPVTQLEREELSRIYLGKKTLWKSGQRIAPAMLDDSSPPVEAFLKGTVAKTSSQFRAYWKRQLFSGGGAPPRTFVTSEQVAEFVARQPGAIGIVESSFANEHVKPVHIAD
jgi:ABC-type phosphate transport system substrate-binding protein